MTELLLSQLGLGLAWTDQFENGRTLRAPRANCVYGLPDHLLSRMYRRCRRSYRRPFSWREAANWGGSSYGCL